MAIHITKEVSALQEPSHTLNGTVVRLCEKSGGAFLQYLDKRNLHFKCAVSKLKVTLSRSRPQAVLLF